MGVLYPAYASFKAVELLRLRGEGDEAARWLTYWAVAAAFAAAEKALAPLARWVPYYSTLKVAFLLWLQLPRYGGAGRLSAAVARPALRRAHPAVDAALAALRAAVMRPEVLALAAAVNEAAARVPVLEWLVRGPDGRPVVTRRGVDGGGAGGAGGGAPNFITGGL